MLEHHQIDETTPEITFLGVSHAKLVYCGVKMIKNTILEIFRQLSIIEPAKATGFMGSPLCGLMDGWVDVCNELISETAPTIFLELGMKLGDNKGKNSTARFLIKTLILADFGQTCRKMAKITVFGTLQKPTPTNFLKMH